MTRAAFSTPTSAPAQNVTIQNVYVQMYAIPAQMGAIGMNVSEEREKKGDEREQKED